MSDLRELVEERIGELDDEAFLWLVLACLPSSEARNPAGPIWPDGVGGFRDAAGIELLRAAARDYLGR